VRRREFIALLSGAVGSPLDALAQQASKVWHMGFIAHEHESFAPAFGGADWLKASRTREEISPASP
jgi:hypothetical protein